MIVLSEAGQLTCELHRKFLYENNTRHRTFLNTAPSGACSHAMAMEVRQNIENSEHRGGVQRAAHLEFVWLDAL